ncbi:MAG: methytransferase partner Trm112 [Thermoplasmata archaeon]
MKTELLEILRCPACRGTLQLSAPKKDGAEIVSGTLTCASCSASYPIEDGIPDLLPPGDLD